MSGESTGTVKSVNKNVWLSPDGRIKKTILEEGRWGCKPGENSECKIAVVDASDADFLTNYNGTTTVIGESNTEFERLLHNCLLTMCEQELAWVTFNVKRNVVFDFKLQLLECRLDGQIWEWDAKKKYDLAVKHKNTGNELFKTSYVDASHRFNRALKILSSIPIAVGEELDEVDGLKVSEINALKANLFSNLASCYLRHQKHERVVDLCKKVLKIDETNVKALYKLGVAYFEERDFERAQETFLKLVAIDPNNKLAAEKLKLTTVRVNSVNARVDCMIKKMFPIS